MRVQDKLDEMAATMCSFLFQQYKQTPAQLHTEVIRAVTIELDDGRGRELDPGDSCKVAVKVDDTVHMTIGCLQLCHKVDMLTMYAITHAMINRSQEEKMDQDQGKHLLGWQQSWTWAHHARLVEVKDGLTRFGGYSVRSPVDLLGNADQHLNSLFT